MRNDESFLILLPVILKDLRKVWSCAFGLSFCPNLPISMLNYGLQLANRSDVAPVVQVNFYF